MISIEIPGRRDQSSPTPEGRPYGRTGSKGREISNKQAPGVSFRASDPYTVTVSEVGSVPDQGRTKRMNTRSPVATSRDGALVVDFYDRDAIVLNICEVPGIILRLVAD